MKWFWSIVSICMLAAMLLGTAGCKKTAPTGAVTGRPPSTKIVPPPIPNGGKAPTMTPSPTTLPGAATPPPAAGK